MVFPDPRAWMPVTVAVPAGLAADVGAGLGVTTNVGVSVGGTGVLVDVGVSVGAAGVLVGVRVSVGGTGVLVEVGVAVTVGVFVGVVVAVGVLVEVGVSVGACKSKKLKALLLPLRFAVMHNGYPGVFDWPPLGLTLAFSGTDWPPGPTAVGSSHTV
jgi:hypothetical protein